jgi:folylpolyglutamate synthase/dihydropteroate synthase
VCVYSSPHVRHVRERLQTADTAAPITAAAFTALVARHAPRIAAAQAACGGALTHFEVTTALALSHFADVAPDVAIIEVGLGGAHDATNVFSERNVEAAVVTLLDMEHTAALGSTMTAIARAKAGIFKCVV